MLKPILTSVFLAALVIGCKTPPLAKPPTVVCSTDFTNKLSDFPDLKAFPVIDIHTHTFNARYLPIENIALARRYDSLPWRLGYLLPNKWVTEIAEAIVDAAELAPTNTAASASAPGETNELNRAAVSENEKTRRGAMERKRQKEPKADAKKLQLSDREMEKATRLLAGRKHGDDELDDLAHLGFLRFLALLKSDERTVRRYLTNEEFPGVDLFVHHTMDLGPVYAQPPHGRKFLDFHTAQLDRARLFDRESGGRFIHFVAFSPFRATNSFEDAWAPVQEALNRGAWGVKVYPPSGYRPAGNDVPSKPWFPATLRHQWTARYGNLKRDGMSADERLDAIMLEFFRRCVSNDIPVFAHCSYGEFEAAKGYGENNANPKYWARLLQNHPELHNLRLCIGHAGGGDYWFGTGDHQRWGRTVIELCKTYPNVYCEFGVLDGILRGTNNASRAFVANVLIDEINRSGGVLAKKILYGSDWFMPIIADPRSDYIGAYRDVFLTAPLRCHYRDFFCLNAVRFLDLNASRIAANPILTEPAKDHLKSFLRTDPSPPCEHATAGRTCD